MRRQTTSYLGDAAYVKGAADARCQCLEVCVCQGADRQTALKNTREALKRLLATGSRENKEAARRDYHYWLGYANAKGAPDSRQRK